MWTTDQVQTRTRFADSRQQPNRELFAAPRKPHTACCIWLAHLETHRPWPIAWLFFVDCMPELPIFFPFSLHGTNPYHQDLFSPPRRPDHLRVPRGTRQLNSLAAPAPKGHNSTGSLLDSCCRHFKLSSQRHRRREAGTDMHWEAFGSRYPLHPPFPVNQ